MHLHQRRWESRVAKANAQAEQEGADDAEASEGAESVDLRGEEGGESESPKEEDDVDDGEGVNKRGSKGRKEVKDETESDIEEGVETESDKEEIIFVEVTQRDHQRPER